MSSETITSLAVSILAPNNTPTAVHSATTTTTFISYSMDGTTTTNSSTSNNNNNARNDTASPSLQELSDRHALEMLAVLLAWGLLLLLGLLGNSLVLYVYGARFKPSGFRTAILSLAVLDLLSCLVAIPGEMIDLRFSFSYPSDLMCRVLRAGATFPSVASGLMLTAVARDRYLLICSSPLSRVSGARARVWRHVLLACATSFVLTCPAAAVYGSAEVKAGPRATGWECSTSDVVKDSALPLIYSLVLLAVFLTNFTAMVVLYVLIGLHIYRQGQFRRTLSLVRSHSRTATHSEQEMSLVSDAESKLNNASHSSDSAAPQWKPKAEEGGVDEGVKKANPSGSDGVETSPCDAMMRPLSDGVTSSPCDGMTTPLCDGMTNPLCDGVITPLCDWVTTPLSDGVTTPLCDGMTTPLCDSMTTPLCNGVTTPPLMDTEGREKADNFDSNGITRPSSEGVTKPPSESLTPPPRDNVTTPFCDGVTTPGLDSLMRPLESSSCDGLTSPLSDGLATPTPSSLSNDRLTTSRPSCLTTDSLTTPPGDNLTTLPGDNLTTPPGDNLTMPPGDNLTTPPGDNLTTPPGDNLTTPPFSNLTTPPGDNLTTLPGDNLTTPPGDNLTTPPGDNLTTAPGDNLTMPLGDKLTTPPGDDNLTTPPNDEHSTSPCDGLTSRPTSLSSDRVTTPTTNVLASSEGSDTPPVSTSSGRVTVSAPQAPQSPIRKLSRTPSALMQRIRRSTSVDAHTRKTTVMLCLISMAFVLSYLPHLAVKLLRKDSQPSAAYHLCARSYFLNSVINVFIYGFCSLRFRRECHKAVKKLLLLRCCR